MDSPLRCECGKLQGALIDIEPRKVNRIMCYCDDCQAFAHYLSPENPKMEAQGGMDIVQMAPLHIEFTRGLEHLACMRMSQRGIYRWFAACCRTPIGNTGGFGLPFVGLIHVCIDASEAGGADGLFGPVRVRLHTECAQGEVAPFGSTFSSIRRFAWILVKGKFGGVQKRSPFFDAQTRQPVVAPQELSAEERTQLLARLA
jgi:hypothetical protein